MQYRQSQDRQDLGKGAQTAGARVEGSGQWGSRLAQVQDGRRGPGCRTGWAVTATDQQYAVQQVQYQQYEE